ncbi:MAG: OsmC family protein [Candidatus Helarchaeota archaeon]
MESNGYDLQVELKWIKKLRMRTYVRDFPPIDMDDRKKGNDQAPTPVEMFLSSIGSCLSMAFVYCMHLAGIPLKPGDFVVKMGGKLGRIKERLRLVAVNAEFIIKTKSYKAKVQKCFEKFQPFCILSESIKPAITFSCDLIIKD